MKCPECNGTGTPPWPHNVVSPRCPDCNGKGEIKSRIERTTGIDKTPEYVLKYRRQRAACPKCGHWKHDTTLLALPTFDPKHPEKYYDPNDCGCHHCGDKHGFDERVPLIPATIKEDIIEELVTDFSEIYLTKNKPSQYIFQIDSFHGWYNTRTGSDLIEMFKLFFKSVLNTSNKVHFRIFDIENNKVVLYYDSHIFCNSYSARDSIFFDEAYHTRIKTIANKMWRKSGCLPEIDFWAMAELSIRQ